MVGTRDRVGSDESEFEFTLGQDILGRLDSGVSMGINGSNGFGKQRQRSHLVLSSVSSQLGCLMISQGGTEGKGHCRVALDWHFKDVGAVLSVMLWPPEIAAVRPRRRKCHRSTPTYNFKSLNYLQDLNTWSVGATNSKST